MTANKSFKKRAKTDSKMRVVCKITLFLCNGTGEFSVFDKIEAKAI